MVAGKAKFCDRLWFKDHMLVYFGVLHLAQWVGSTAVLKITTFHTELVVMQRRNDIPRSKSKMKIASFATEMSSGSNKVSIDMSPRIRRCSDVVGEDPHAWRSWGDFVRN